MWCEDYIHIQRIQSCLTLYANSRMYDKILEDLFADNDDIAIDIQAGEGMKICGRGAVENYFNELQKKVLANGNTLGTNQGTSQYIEIHPGQETAFGRWYTYTVHIEGPAFGNRTPPYPYHMMTGIYENQFCRTSLGWRLQKITWRPLFDLGRYECTPQEDGNLHADVKYWPRPYPCYNDKTGPVISEEDQEDLLWCQNVMEIENLHGAFVHDWNRANFEKMEEKYFAEAGAELFVQGLGETLSGQENLKKYFEHMAGRARTFDGSCGIQLATSRVIEVDPGQTKARAMWTSLSMEILSPLSDHRLKMSNITGRWYLDLVKENGRWKYEKYWWTAFCSMTPFKGRRIENVDQGYIRN